MAQPPSDLRTFFTFSSSVAIPGVTLPAGKYLFRLVDTDTRGVVQVLSADGKTPYAMFFAYRVQRREPSAEPEVRFMETALGMPQAIRSWWYPADRSGYEFVYPKEQARLLAKGTAEGVLATETAIARRPETPPVSPPELSRISPAGEETKIAEAAPGAPSGAVRTGEIAPASITVAAATLPKTASATPLIGVGGLVLLMGAGFIRVWRAMEA